MSGVYNGPERRAAVIDMNTKLNLRMVVEIVVLVCTLTAGWFSIKYEILDMRKDMTVVIDQLKDMNATRWRPVNDYIFMQRYSDANNLKMIPHPGAE